MSSLELSSMTVIELRKLAKEKHVRLGAGLSKDGIIQKLTAALAGESTEEATEQVVEETPAAAPETEAKEPAAQEEETPAVQTAQQTSQEAPAREERTASAHFKAAWHNPSPRYSAKPAYQAPAYSSRPAWQARSASAPRTTANTDTVRMNTTRPTNYAPRFGPDAVDPAPAPSVQRGTEEYRSFREKPRNFGGFQENRSIYGERSWSEQQRSSFQEGGYVASSYGTNAPAGYGPRASYTSRRADTGYYNQELGNFQRIVL